MVNGSLGGSKRFQNLPFQPGSLVCETPSTDEYSNPAVCEPSWRIVIFDFWGSCCHCLMYLAAKSSSAICPSVIATAQESPPTTAFAIEAVKCVFSAEWPSEYH